MARKFSDLRARMSPESQERARSKARTLLKSVPLIAPGRGLSQKDLATALHVQQPTIARIEKRTDMYISTLRIHWPCSLLMDSKLRYF